jgi:selenide,water dikinase
MNAPLNPIAAEPRLTSLSHGGGCGCKIAPGVLSAALKKEQLEPAGYRRMIDTTTKLNTPGPELAALAGVHALTDVTGFGLAGHALELARGAQVDVAMDWRQVPVLEGVRELAGAGFVTGASGRNWAGYGASIALPAGFAAVDQALLSDPQTSGGLLVSCTKDEAQRVIDVFRAHGFAQAAVIGECVAAAGEPRVVVR